MAYFAVEYVYDPSKTELMDQVRPRHRAYLGALRDEGKNLGSGLLSGDAPGALLILKADAEADVLAMLDADPFHEAGVVSSRTVREWNPVIRHF